MNPTNELNVASHVESDAIIKEIVIKAPAARIFEALADPAQRVKWWGTEGRFQATHMESDLRPGYRVSRSSDNRSSQASRCREGSR